MESEKIIFYNIESRAKKVFNFERKLRQDISDNPKKMQDLVGIRVICYVESDIKRVSEIIKKNFKVDKKKIMDKTQQLGIDRVGYRSQHFVVSLDDNKKNIRILID